MKPFLVPVAALTALLAVPAHAAGEFKLFPVLDAGYTAKAALSVKGGVLSPDHEADAGAAFGAELSLNCPLIQLPGGTIRQQISYNHFDHDGLRIQSLEINPHYMVAVTDSLSIGAGPGVGYVWADSDRGRDDSMWAVQLGVSAAYTMGAVQLGLESRYQWTEGERIGRTSDGADNWLTTLKLGYRF